MNKDVAVFFDGLANTWDSTNNCDSRILEEILDKAKVKENDTVLDVGSGTGVLIPYLLSRKAQVTAMDVSAEMLKVSKEKFGDDIAYICADIADFDTDKQFDRVIVHNAFPHFTDREKAVKNLKALTGKGGTLTVAHSISREAVLKCHENVPHISLELPEAEALADMMKDGITDITVISDDEKYIVTGIKS